MARHLIPFSDRCICSHGIRAHISGFARICHVIKIVVGNFLVIINDFIYFFIFFFRQVGCDMELSTYSAIAGLWASMYSLG